MLFKKWLCLLKYNWIEIKLDLEHTDSVLEITLIKYTSNKYTKLLLK